MSCPSASGEFIDRDGAKIWFKTGGQGPIVFFLHGGPGYNSFAFETCVGAALECDFKMVYLDQRGGGRSNALEAGAPLNLSAVLDDIEAVRQKVSAESISFIAHSFGGLVALEYLRAHPGRVEKLILIDISPDLPAAFRHQLHTMMARFPDHAEALRKIAASDLSVTRQLGQAFRLIGPKPLNHALLWHNREVQLRYNTLDLQSSLISEDRNPLAHALLSDGYLDTCHLKLMTKLHVPAVAFAGRHSQCIGWENLNTAAALWEAPLVPFENSGHFPYAEEPEKFVHQTRDFLIHCQ